MAVVSILVIPVTADPSSLGGKLVIANTMVAQFAGGVQAHIAGTAAAAVAHFIDEVRKQFEVVDQLSKSAQKLGIAGEVMAGLAHGANLAGVEAKELETAMGKMLRTTAEAALGGKEAGDAFARIGLNAAARDGSAASTTSAMPRSP